MTEVFVNCGCLFSATNITINSDLLLHYK